MSRARLVHNPLELFIVGYWRIFEGFRDVDNISLGKD